MAIVTNTLKDCLGGLEIMCKASVPGVPLEGIAGVVMVMIERTGMAPRFSPCYAPPPPTWLAQLDPKKRWQQDLPLPGYSFSESLPWCQTHLPWVSPVKWMAGATLASAAVGGLYQLSESLE